MNSKVNALLVPPPHRGPAPDYDEMVDKARATLPMTLPTDPKQVLLALDVDGTLLVPDGASPRVKKSLQDASDAGINVVIATGRGIGSTRPVFDELQMPDGYGVSANGAQTLHWRRIKDGYQPEILKEVTFHPQATAEILLRAVPELLLGVDYGIDGLLVSRPFPPGELMSQQQVGALQELLDKQTPRMIARAPWMDRDDFADLIHGLPLDQVEVAVGWTAWADISPLGVTKASALEGLARELGVSPTGTIAMGDGSNDIDMLRWAAHGVAMGGASRQVVDAADATTGPVDYDGAAAVIEALLERY